MAESRFLHRAIVDGLGVIVSRSFSQGWFIVTWWNNHKIIETKYVEGLNEAIDCAQTQRVQSWLKKID